VFILSIIVAWTNGPHDSWRKYTVIQIERYVGIRSII